jgi:hypothetical protein
MAAGKRLAMSSALQSVFLITATLFIPMKVLAPPISPPALQADSPHEENPRRIYYSSGRGSEWVVDDRRFPIKSLLKISKKMRFGDFAWDDENVPAGPSWILVDLSLQTISIFRHGHEIGTAVILYGSDATPTPTGIFPIIERARRHRSTLYDADMNYMLRLTMDGVAIHASSVREGYATHGCIGIPNAFAERLFDTMMRGDLVTIRQHAPAVS